MNKVSHNAVRVACSNTQSAVPTPLKHTYTNCIAVSEFSLKHVNCSFFLLSVECVCPQKKKTKKKNNNNKKQQKTNKQQNAKTKQKKKAKPKEK